MESILFPVTWRQPFVVEYPGLVFTEESEMEQPDAQKR